MKEDSFAMRDVNGFDLEGLKVTMDVDQNL